MPYLTIDVDHIRQAWEDFGRRQVDLSGSVLALEEQLDSGRQAVAVHMPESRPHGVYCRNCGHVYPCQISLWGMGLLRARGWDLADVVDLVEAMQAGERS